MEFELLDGEIYELEEVKAETLSKLKYAVEWHYEATGELIDLDFLIDEVDKEMEQEKWLYNACDTFWIDVEKVYEELAEEIATNSKDWDYQSKEQNRDRGEI